MTSNRCFLCTHTPHTPTTHTAFIVTSTHAPTSPAYFKDMAVAVQSARMMVAGHPEWEVGVEVVVEGEGRVFLLWEGYGPNNEPGPGWWFVSTTGARRAVLREMPAMAT